MIKALLSLLLLIVGTALVAHAMAHRNWELPGAVLATAGVTAWTLTNARFEGPVLLIAFPGNGLTLADLLSVPAAVLVIRLCLRNRRR